MRRRWVDWVAGAVLAVPVLGLLRIIGPSGSGYRTNQAFAVCWEDAAAREPAGEEFFARVVECKTQYCPPRWEPSRLEKVGLFLQTRLSEKDSPSRVDPPELGNIILPGVGGESGIRFEPERLHVLPFQVTAAFRVA